MQTTTWTFGRITLACAAIGVLAAVAISLAQPDHYVSEAKIRITPEQIPENGPPVAANQLMWDRLLRIDQDVRSRSALASIIQQHNLYPRERTHMPLLDVVEMMHKEIVVRPIIPPGGNRVIPAVAIEFDYPDAHVAQQVTADLMSRFIEASLRENAMNHNANRPSVMWLEPLDTASLPTRPSGPNRTTIAGAGLFAGLLTGLTLAIVVRSRRRTTSCPTCGQRVAAQRLKT
jgi:uncharacterized protein involved in exopolysaccharide biosynthesis